MAREYAKLFAPAVSNDSQIDCLAGFHVAKRILQLADISGSFSVDSYDDIVRFRAADLLDERNPQYGRRKIRVAPTTMTPSPTSVAARSTRTCAARMPASSPGPGRSTDVTLSPLNC